MKKLIFLTLMALSSLASNAQDDSYKATLLKMFTVSGTDESYKGAVEQMIGMFKAQNPEVPVDIWNEFQLEFMKTSLNDLVEMLAPVYQKYLTKSDLEDIIAFYNTPTGKKYAGNTPNIMQESMQVGQQWGMQLGQTIQQKLEEKGY